MDLFRLPCLCVCCSSCLDSVSPLLMACSFSRGKLKYLFCFLYESSSCHLPSLCGAEELLCFCHAIPYVWEFCVFTVVVPLLPNVLKPPVRTVTYYSSRKGKRKTVKAAVYRFLRLHSGLWLRRKAGYKKKLWKKTVARKRRLREFVFCNKTQSKLLDKMTTSFWKRRNWYADDLYQKYHDRTNLKV
ncbi:39S ribosomal protein L35, mitochondrial, partial [Eschrichtius robustus]|nr:39S ribosomal protein L35, mitochondrial [Eschrichtius robustus]